MDDSELHNLQNACDELIRRQNSLLIASRSVDGAVAISYAPYFRDETGFYIFISELARHTQNLLAQPQASILFIEPEATASNPFARQRLTFDCVVREISKSHEDYAQKLDAMALKFGEIVDVLRTLPDFHLLVLQPQTGQFVAGFGKAFSVDSLGRLQ
ncbi:HugZ family protein [Methylomonas methanica]|uniref:Pyridoxamine 5'-phosphate oxidase-related FMN-binding protein n=1 Tax=Methylomonas methanica (strain DSM 25384 / MC09) TaxID=857087 RepID=F9ZZJ7_METMM|nr:pyridoxamine 5'-phosphate oxidase family protein [Methylomonas methanica]AEG02390.1 pyridoxamine 5'-phosphate oxidase-related FMN-binding protein [Methylomonas methanica MC09]